MPPKAMTYRTQIKDRIKEILSDNQWHPVGEILADVTDSIPPEAATRRLGTGERERLIARGEEDHIIRRGKRSMLGDLLSDLGAEIRGRGNDAEARYDPMSGSVYRSVRLGEINRWHGIEDVLEEVKAFLISSEPLNAEKRLQLLQMIMRIGKSPNGKS